MLKIVKNEILTYTVYENFVKELNGKYENLKITTCGKSLLGKELFAFVIGEGKNTVVYVGGTHGIEWLTSLLLLKFTENLAILTLMVLKLQLKVRLLVGNIRLKISKAVKVISAAGVQMQEGWI